jgi:hypothetical protein
MRHMSHLIFLSPTSQKQQFQERQSEVSCPLSQTWERAGVRASATVPTLNLIPFSDCHSTLLHRKINFPQLQLSIPAVVSP